MLMSFEAYQSAVVEGSRPEDLADDLVPLLGVGAHVGSLMGAHHQYLRDVVEAGIRTDLVASEVGLTLRHAALVLSMHDLDLCEVAGANLRKVVARARSLGMRVHLGELPRSPSPSEYQLLSSYTDQQVEGGLDPFALGVPLLGLAGESGNLLVDLKKRLRGDPGLPEWSALVATEIGDLLWYATAVARHCQLELDEILRQDLKRLSMSRESAAKPSDLEGLEVLDERFPDTERFPRKLVIRFRQTQELRSTVRISLVNVHPNAFPNGPVDGPTGKRQGFEIGQQIGAPVNDNSPEEDAYRFHDAIHLGFLAVMGWSPNMRGLLALKRRSDATVDEDEDGARATFAEEGMAAFAAKRARNHQPFTRERYVDELTIEVFTSVLEHYEVSRLPDWLWRRALHQGFTVMTQLAAAGGGFVLADLDKRSLVYSKTEPKL